MCSDVLRTRRLRRNIIVYGMPQCSFQVCFLRKHDGTGIRPGGAHAPEQGGMIVPRCQLCGQDYATGVVPHSFCAHDECQEISLCSLCYNVAERFAYAECIATQITEGKLAHVKDAQVEDTGGARRNDPEPDRI
jgi:hypothetical protein